MKRRRRTLQKSDVKGSLQQQHGRSLTAHSCRSASNRLKLSFRRQSELALLQDRTPPLLKRLRRPPRLRFQSYGSRYCQQGFNLQISANISAISPQKALVCIIYKRSVLRPPQPRFQSYGSRYCLQGFNSANISARSPQKTLVCIMYKR